MMASIMIAIGRLKVTNLMSTIAPVGRRIDVVGADAIRRDCFTLYARYRNQHNRKSCVVAPPECFTFEANARQSIR